MRGQHMTNPSILTTDLPRLCGKAITDTLAGTIARAIDEAGGWLGFDDFMALALYAPGLGYYASANCRRVLATRWHAKSRRRLRPAARRKSGSLAPARARWRCSC